MILAKLPPNEKTRLSALKDHKLFNTEPEQNFDNITKLASFICKMPVSLITLIGKNKQWFKSKVGTDICEGPKDISHCSHAILHPDELMEVEDTRKDPRFADNPYTTDANTPIIFYAGMPLKAHNGLVLGTLCVMDIKPNSLDNDQKDALKALAKQVENLFELQLKNLHLEKTRKKLKTRNGQLKDFAGTVSHDMKMPLANIVMTVDLLKAKYIDKLDSQGLQYLDYLKQSSFKLSDYVTGILDHYESDTLSESLNEDFDIHDLLEQIIDLLNIHDDCVINLPENNKVLNGNRAALQQIFLNLLTNSLKYNNKEKIIIDVTCSKDDKFYHFTVSDNGIGIPKDKQEEIFKLFTVLVESDRRGNRGNGIGLSTVKKLVSTLGGNISVNSEVNKGTTFNFSIKRVH
jgi:hypothetical protein